VVIYLLFAYLAWNGCR